MVITGLAGNHQLLKNIFPVMAHLNALQPVLTLRHKSLFFTPQTISHLQNSGALDLADFISLVFLICENCRFYDMYPSLVSYLKLTDFPATLNFFDIFSQFPNWERMLIEALERINNKKALFLLKIQPFDLSAANHTYCLNGSRVILYRIMEELNESDGKSLIELIKNLGAPMPNKDLPHLELYFMFWNMNGFLNVDNQEGFEHVAQSLHNIGKSHLAYTLGYCPEQFYNRSLFDDDFPIEAYPIQDPRNTGLCLIINQVRYGGKDTDRESSLVDVGKLKRLMTSFNFTVVALEDVGAREFCESIRRNVLEQFLENYSVFMLVVMAHGELDYVTCPASNIEETANNIKQLESKGNKYLRGNVVKRRANKVHVKDIQNCIFNCNVLRGKPKIFILNACRGDKHFTTRDYFATVQMAADEDMPEVQSMVDIITCYSALPDFFSLRDKEKGALFINVFCDVLSKRPEIEICELFTLINARLMQPTPDLSRGFQKGYKGDVYKVASPFEFTSSLTKKLYFNLPNSRNKI